MSVRPSARRKTLYLLGSFLGLVVAPLWLWAVRAPDAAYAPLPDYDLRKGYTPVLSFRDPRLADEVAVLRQQRAAKLALLSEKWEAAPAAPDRAQAEAAFGGGVSVQWNANGTVASLTAGEHPLAPAQPGLDPEAAARQFLRTHQLVLGLDEATLASLETTPRGVSAPDGQVIVFRQTVGGVPVFQAELKVSLRADNAVEGVAGALYPALNVSPAARLSAVEAAVQAAGYVGPLGLKPGKDSGTRPSPEELTGPAAEWVTSRSEDSGEFLPTVLSVEAGPEQKTVLAPGPFRLEVRASQVVFPLSASEGRPAWQVYLMKSPLESYRVVVDAEDGALLNRTGLVKFSQPQGLVFLTHPDDGAQMLRSFVGSSTASRRTFVTATQSGLQGNNVIMGIGANNTTGPRHFEFAFTDDYKLSGGILNNFNLNGVTLRFTPNASGGYDMTLPAFADALAGSSLGLTDESAACGAAPPGFSFFGVSITTGCVSSNGNVTVNEFSASIFVPPFDFIEDQLSLSLGRGRIMGLWDDLDPDAGGFVGISFTGSASSPTTLCFRWNSVPEFGIVNANSFSICLFGTGNSSALPVGTIQLSYAGVAALDGMVGIAPGLTGKGQPRSAGFSNFSGPASTIGANGLARLFPDHDDAAAAAANVFWAFNEIGHDRQYLLGFDEKNRNMQWKNFTKKGLGKDAVVAASGLVLDGLFFNNAFFGPSNEGVCCPISAFGLFTAAAGFRDVDSAFDTDVVVHEYGHGVSTRLAGSLDTPQSGAMGEGWSDWFALDYSGDPVMGEYITGNPTTGIRGVAYDASSPRHFGDFGNIFGPLSTGNGVVFLPEVHDDGEIWATMLADLRTTLLGAGVPATNVSKLIIQGLKNTPANASMLQARDGLISGAAKLGINQCTLWQVFAANGFGFSASDNEAPDTNLASDSFNVFQSFDRTAICGGSFSTGTLLNSYNFDSALVGDTSADGWAGTGLWHVSDNRHTTGTLSFYFGSEVTGNYQTCCRAAGNLTSPVLDLSAATHPVLEMDLFVDVEESFDLLWVRVSTDGGATFPIQRAFFFWDTNAAFRRVRLDLEPLAGQANARIQVYFDTFDSIANTFEGIFVDNVAVRNYTEN